ncbi:MAG: septal ring lytic transglycosylase RlpA family protein [Cyanobacteria bacterium P01_F01_bin.150]
MSRTFLRSSLAATVAVVSFGLAAPGQANESGKFSDLNVAENVPQGAYELASDQLKTEYVPAGGVVTFPHLINGDSQLTPIDTDTAGSTPIPVAKIGEMQTVDTAVPRTAIATIYAHDLDNRAAATVYVRDIPVFTFLAPEGWVPSGNAEGAILASSELDANDPAVRATALASLVNQYSENGGDASAISVRWQEESDAYLVEAGATLLLTMDENVILPNTTGASAEDALQATNLLRRQLGESEALAKVEGLPEPQPVVATAVQSTFSGMASWYGPGFHGRTSASGERFNQYAMTAAHRTLPFGTMVEVVNLNNGASTVVRINDRGPYSHGRVIDLSAAAAQEIGMMGSGVAPVSVNVLDSRTASR